MKINIISLADISNTIMQSLMLVLIPNYCIEQRYKNSKLKQSFKLLGNENANNSNGLNNLNDYETVDFENYNLFKVSNDEDKFYYACYGTILSLDRNESKKIVTDTNQLIINGNIYSIKENSLYVDDINHKDNQKIFELNGNLNYSYPFPNLDSTYSEFDILMADNSKIFIKPYFYYDIKQKKGVIIDHLRKYGEDENFTSLSICNNKYVFTYTKTIVITDKNFNILKEINPGNCISPPVVIEDKLYFQITSITNARDLEFEKPDYYYLDIDDYKITKIYQSES